MAGFKLPVVLGTIASVVSLAVAQSPTPAQCNASAGFDWAKNSLGQDPCTVASYMGGVCSSGVLTIPALEPTQSYTGPPLAQAGNTCLCSTVYYSLLSACAACQERSFSPWSTYDRNCTSVYVGVFLGNIPSGTRVPHWAYDDVRILDTFDAKSAQTEINAPESSGTAVPTQGGNTSPTVAAPASSKSKAGAIAGGVIGGLVAVVLAIGAAIVIIRRRRNRTPPSGLVNLNPDGGSPTFHGPSPVYPAPKLYDPSDPSTFPPASPGTSMFTSYTDPQPFASTIYSQEPSLHPNRAHPGVAEV